MSYKIYLVRHGQTILNRYNRMQGWCDSPLTPKGIEDAHEAGRRLKRIKFAYAFHSDTTRAMRKSNDKNLSCHAMVQRRSKRTRQKSARIS